MLTNEQSFEVVEKVWGWDGEMITDHWREAKIYAEIKDHIRNEVNSWQGFGKTVEAMVNARVQYRFEWLTGNYEAYVLSRLDKEGLWERTHLAALEALK